MTCAERTAEIVECVRRGAEPGWDLKAHLASCTACGNRWQAEHQLTDQFRRMSLRAAALMALDTERDGLMRDFARLNLAGKQRQKAVRSWVLAFGAAAALLAAIAVGHLAGTRARPTAPQAGPARGVRNPQSVIYEAGAWEESGDASALTDDDFVAVPYTPPLAQGELVRVVHADLYPEALASIGINVDPGSASNIPVEVVVGEDGIPRAVRFTGSAQN